MNKKLAFVSLLSFLALMSVLQSARAATIPSAALDRDSYFAGETGYITVSVYNDESDRIRVTELSASVNYYYADGTVYVQKFFSSEVLPDEIDVGQTASYIIPISLPTNIAHGFLDPVVEARTDLWWAAGERWTTSERPLYSLKLYVESSYKQSYENSQEELANTEDQLQTAQEQLTSIENQLEEHQLLIGNLNSMVIMFAATTLVFATVAAFLGFYMFSKRARAIQQQP